MYKSKVSVVLVVSICISFIAFLITDNIYMATIFSYLIQPSVTLIYFLNVKQKPFFFTLFLVLFSISDLLQLLSGYLPHVVDYYLGNSLYIIAYSCLLLEIFKSISFAHIIKNFKMHLVVLTTLSVYIVYVLQGIVHPSINLYSTYFIDFIYNIVMISLLSVSLLNYLYRDNKKSLFLFIGSLSIVFSEVIGIAYLYISEERLLQFILTALVVIAFYFFYQQSKLKNEQQASSIIE